MKMDLISYIKNLSRHKKSVHWFTGFIYVLLYSQKNLGTNEYSMK